MQRRDQNIFQRLASLHKMLLRHVVLQIRRRLPLLDKRISIRLILHFPVTVADTARILLRQITQGLGDCLECCGFFRFHNGNGIY